MIMIAGRSRRRRRGAGAAAGGGPEPAPSQWQQTALRVRVSPTFRVSSRVAGIRGWVPGGHCQAGPWADDSVMLAQLCMGPNIAIVRWIDEMRPFHRVFKNA